MTQSPVIFVTEIQDAPLSGAVLRELTRATLERGKPFRFCAHGYSMSPFIRDGDVLTIAPLTIAPRIGDVVAFVSSPHDRLIVHRIIAATRDGFLIKGDNVSEPDGVMPREQLLGRVARVERDGRARRGGLRIERAAIAWLSKRNVLLTLQAAFNFPRRIAAAILRRAQNFALYRALARRFQIRPVIAEASEPELARVQARFNPGVWLPPTRRNPNATHYVAKFGAQIAGFVELVRHPPEHYPYVGYWLFGLHVWTRYRGLSIGEQLSRRVMEQARAEGARELLLLVYEDNPTGTFSLPAINLYRKLGFARVKLPALEAQLQAEKTQTGRRRIVMRYELNQGGRE